MSKNFLPYSKQCIDQEDIDAVVKTLRSNWITQGPSIEAFEEKCAQKVGAKYAVAVANGTAALHLAYLCIGISEDDEVITTANTFVATSNGVLYCGGKPVFADIDEETGLISVDDIKAKITPKTKAIAPVDFSGCPANLEAIQAIAKEHNLFIIQDAAHSMGACYKNSKVGDCQYADLTILSFHPVKPITTGEGGVITTNNKDFYNKLCRLRSHGITKDLDLLSYNAGPWYYEMIELGFNYRMTDIQAALGISQLDKLEPFILSRQENAAYYDKSFANCEEITPLKVGEGCTSGYHLYVVKIDFTKQKTSRAEVMTLLKDQGIGTQVHYIPVYSQPYYQNNGYEDISLEHTERYYNTCLSIPNFPFMTSSDQDRVVSALKDCVKK